MVVPRQLAHQAAEMERSLLSLVALCTMPQAEAAVTGVQLPHQAEAV